MYIILISVHGLIRSTDLELGRDADTGGQVQYVIDLLKKLSELSEVSRVDLVTRQVIDSKVDIRYSQEVEHISGKTRIVRITCGPKRYLRKEVLWPYLNVFSDELLRYIRSSGEIPSIIHSHYADAGYVALRVANWLDVPFIHTGHSLGRVKRKNLLEQGLRPEVIESQFNFDERIEAEESVLEAAASIICSTNQEIQEQYKLYDHYNPNKMIVIPPGIDEKRFHPGVKVKAEIDDDIGRFYRRPNLPIILALSRPVPRKNIQALVHAYGSSNHLKEKANLLLILGQRTDIREMESSPKQVMIELLLLIDKYDLYGHVAYPKSMPSSDTGSIYRLVANSGGVLVNPAFSEPFGLTLIEAAACGLPILATNDGGPRDILRNCQNGLTIDPFDIESIQESLHAALTSPILWDSWSRSGVLGVQRHYTWRSHIAQYMAHIRGILDDLKNVTVFTNPKPMNDATTARGGLYASRLLMVRKLLITDIDNTLTGDQKAIDRLVNYIYDSSEPIGFGVATGRSLESAKKVLSDHNVPSPDIWITSVGSEIHYGAKCHFDTSWRAYINYKWQPEGIRALMGEFSGIELQSSDQQRIHKISYLIKSDAAPSLREIRTKLRKSKIHAKAIISHGKFLDFLPLRASKGDAVHYCALKWNFPLNMILVAGDSGNDADMLAGNVRSVVVGNYSPELEKLRTQPQIYFANASYAYGIIEGVSHYNF